MYSLLKQSTLLVLFACLTLVPGVSHAQGHMLHGMGPVNSSMGGAGTALPIESVGALTFNPALLAKAEGNQITFATEFFQDGLRIETTLNGRTGVSNPTLILGVIPAFGWQMRAPDGKMALGFGLIGIAGFRTDYPEDPASILFEKWPNSFGHIYTDYNLTKIPVAFAYQVTPKLAVGASLNVYRGLLAIAPLPYQVFDVDETRPPPNRFYPLGGNMVPAWAISGQFGLYYEHNDMASFGLSITTPQNFSKYEWNSFFINPSADNFGAHRDIDFDLDGPLLIGFGTGLKPNEKLDIAIDGHWTKYQGVNGFGSPGGIVDGIVQPFGWRNIWTFKAGVQYRANEKITIRGGYNHSQTPILAEKVLTGTGAPATFQKHFTGGVGLRMFPFLTAEASFYVVPREHIVGPLLSSDLPPPYVVPGGQMDTSNSITSGLIGLNFNF